MILVLLVKSKRYMTLLIDFMLLFSINNLAYWIIQINKLKKSFGKLCIEIDYLQYSIFLAIFWLISLTDK